MSHRIGGPKISAAIAIWAYTQGKPVAQHANPRTPQSQRPQGRGCTRQTVVTMDHRNEHLTEIFGALKANHRVVLDPSDAVRDGGGSMRSRS